jgi:hypothetical protein
VSAAVAALFVAAPMAALVGTTAAGASPVSWATAFTTQGCTQWTMPGVEGEVSVEAIGAAGATGASDGPSSVGGTGDAVRAELVNIASGDNLFVCVDVGGGPAGDSDSGAGGGASGVSLGTDFSSPIVVAGGGGGGATDTVGGAAGIPIASQGQDSTVGLEPGGGGGGGDNTDGRAGNGGSAGSGFTGSCGVAGGTGGLSSAIEPGLGGSGATSGSCGPDFRAGGGGGGGYYGGGGGGSGLDGGGGGGGSDFCGDSYSGGTTLQNCSVISGAGTQTSAGSNSGDAEVLIRYVSNSTSQLDDAATNVEWSGAEVGGASAYALLSVAPTAFEDPSGTVAFSFYKGSSCSGDATTSLAPLLDDGDGTFQASSNTYGPLGAGGYSWDAQYLGDATYGPTSTACGTFSVGTPTPVLQQRAIDAATSGPWSGNETSGAEAYDTANITNTTNGTPPTGKVTYSFFTNGSCTAPAFSTQDVTINPDGSVPPSSDTPPLAPGSYSYEVSYPGDDTYVAASSVCEQSLAVIGHAPMPTVTSVVPNSGLVGGGAGLTITGTGFTIGARVAIGQGGGATSGAIAATNVQVVSPTQITAVTGAATKRGRFHTFVITSGGTSAATAHDYFTYQPKPVVASLTPASGSMHGGTHIVIVGSGFGTGPATVLIGQGNGVATAVSATNVVVVSDTKITAVTPASTKKGAFDVFVSTPDGGTSAPSSARFTFKP